MVACCNAFFAADMFRFGLAQKKVSHDPPCAAARTSHALHAVHRLQAVIYLVDMVLSELGTKINSAFGKLSRSNAIDEQVCALSNHKYCVFFGSESLIVS
jgi:hypothetical protein